MSAAAGPAAPFRWAGPGDLPACHAIRRAVFVEEQGVTVAEEGDGLDQDCLHVLGEAAGIPVATLRVLPRGEEAKIQRVAVLGAHRGTGLGAALMRWTLDRLPAKGFRTAVLGSQVAALPFYARLGFVAEGPEFLDARIPHRTMRLPLGPPRD